MYDKSVPQIIIGISGEAGAGKDTAANVILQVLSEQGIVADKYSMAYPLKEVGKFVFEMTDDDMNDPEGKKREATHGYGMTNRRVLQILGTDAFRGVFNEDIWIDVAVRKISQIPCQVIVIPDIRFDNECDFSWKNGLLIKVSAEGREGWERITENSHASEQGCKGPFLDTLYNNTTQEEFEGKVREFSHDLLLPFILSINSEVQEAFRELSEVAKVIKKEKIQHMKLVLEEEE